MHTPGGQDRGHMFLLIMFSSFFAFRILSH